MLQRVLLAPVVLAKKAAARRTVLSADVGFARPAEKEIVCWTSPLAPDAPNAPSAATPGHVSLIQPSPRARAESARPRSVRMLVLLLVALSARFAKRERVLPMIGLESFVLEEFATQRANARLAVLQMAALRAKFVATLGNAISPLTPVPEVALRARLASMDNVALTLMAFARARATKECVCRDVAVPDALFVNHAPMANAQMMTPRSALVELVRLDHANVAPTASALFLMFVKMGSVCWAVRSCFATWRPSASVPYL